MKKEEAIVILGIFILAAFLISIIILFASAKSEIIFKKTKEIKISYYQNNPEIIEIERNVKAEFIIDDEKIKECFDSLDEEQTGIKQVESTKEHLSFIPQKTGKIEFLCDKIKTNIVVK